MDMDTQDHPLEDESDGHDTNSVVSIYDIMPNDLNRHVESVSEAQWKYSEQEGEGNLPDIQIIND